MMISESTVAALGICTQASHDEIKLSPEAFAAATVPGYVQPLGEGEPPMVFRHCRRCGSSLTLATGGN